MGSLGWGVPKWPLLSGSERYNHFQATSVEGGLQEHRKAGELAVSPSMHQHLVGMTLASMAPLGAPEALPRLGNGG